MKGAALALAALLLIAGCGGSSGGGSTTSSTSTQPRSPGVMGVLHFTLDRLDGKPDDISQYQGKVVLVVNTATECGFTPQFEGLEKLYEQNKGRGLHDPRLPRGRRRPPGTRDDAAINEFCKANFGVSFPMFTKSNVVDEPRNPLYEELNAAVGPPDWNFNKVLLDRSGRPLERWGPETAPDDPELTGAIDAQLGNS